MRFSSSEAVCGALSYRYPLSKRDAYNAWMDGIKAESAAFPGYISTDHVESAPSGWSWTGHR